MLIMKNPVSFFTGGIFTFGLTQEQLGELVNKKRTYISRVENNGSNLTLKTLFDIVEKGLGGKVNISIEV